jgi:hypothetical protein
MKIKNTLVFILCSAACIAAAVFFANNVWAVVSWWSAFKVIGGDTAKMATDIGGFWKALDWSVVDYSAVTTFIPFLGFVCMTRSAWMILVRRKTGSPDFPFFHGADQLNVALGLFGTLWGIVVIGFFKLDTVTMADLMQCLHTALFSTIAAVVWVFVIDHQFVRPFFVKMLEKNGLYESVDEDIVEAVEKFVARLGEASEAFDRRQSEYEAAFEKRHTAYEAAFEKRFAMYEKEFAQRQKEYNEFFLRRIDELEKKAMESENKLAQIRGALKGIV